LEDYPARLRRPQRSLEILWRSFRRLSVYPLKTPLRCAWGPPPGMLMLRRNRKSNVPSALAALCALLGAPLAARAAGPYLAAGYAYSGFETRCDGACDSRASGVRIAGGWNIAGHWSLEALYLNDGRFTASEAAADGSPFQGRAKVSAWGGTAGFFWPVTEPLSLGARLGLVSVKAEFEPGAAPAQAGGSTTTQPIAGLTAAWHFTRFLSARLDFDRSRARMNRANGDLNVASLGVQLGF
jgi:hypothetical protein